jgi:hypothetical protein
MPNLLNMLLLVHFVLASLVAALAMFLPQLLARIGTFDPMLVLKPMAMAYGRLFGVALVGIAVLLWGARISGSSPARRLTIQVMFFHLGVGIVLSAFLTVPLLTKVIALVLFSLLFLAYGYIWLYRPSEI